MNPFAPLLEQVRKPSGFLRITYKSIEEFEQLNRVAYARADRRFRHRYGHSNQQVISQYVYYGDRLFGYILQDSSLHLQEPEYAFAFVNSLRWLNMLESRRGERDEIVTLTNTEWMGGKTRKLLKHRIFRAIRYSIQVSATITEMAKP